MGCVAVLVDDGCDSTILMQVGAHGLVLKGSFVNGGLVFLLLLDGWPRAGEELG